MSRMKTRLALISFCWLIAGITSLHAGDNHVYRCASSEDVYQALKTAKPGDTIQLEGGKVYEIDKSFVLEADGSEDKRITFTSEDDTGQGRYAVISTVGQRKEENLVAIRLHGSFWNISQLEITGKKVPLNEDFWDTHGFRIGIYLSGPEAHDNSIEDIHIHHTHNTAVAIRDQAHHNTFKGMKIHHIGEWLAADYNAHEGEGFYIGSSKGFDEEKNRAIAHDILIEDSVLGPGLLGQYIDLKYAASNVTVRNNILYCGDKSYNDEVVSMAGYANLIEGNKFVGSSEGRTRYIRIFNKKTKVPVRVDYQGHKNIPAPTGRDNKVINNTFFTDDPDILVIKNELKATDSSTLVIENNTIEPLDNY
jgi:hypothetical protein